GNDDRDEALEHIEKLKERIIHRLIFDSYKSKIQSIEKDVILRVNAFRAEYLDELPINLQGIIYKTTDIDERFMRIIAQEFQIPTVQTTLKIQDSSQIILDGKSNKIIINPNEVDLNEFSRLEKAHYFQIGDHPTYKPSKVEVYASMAHRKHIEKALSSNWYKGIAPFKTEYMFLTKGRIPTEYEQYVIFKDLFRRSQGRPVYVRIPDFREDKPIGHMKGVTTDMNSFADNSLIFSRHLNAIARAAHEENPDLRMVLPMIRMNDEIEFWKWQIWSSYSSHQMRVPDVGITVETESALQYFEEYDYLNFVLIGLNDLTEEVSDDCDRFSELTVKKFKEIFHPDLRDLHQHYRRKNKITKHIIGGNVLHNPSIFRELLKWGFRNFSIPVDKIKRIEPVITHYNETRGRFIGVAEERKRKIQEKTLEKQKSITLNK
ncbi:MAG: hypothetical protein EOM23_07340, partial [Candidatus Moranbacteria bacterium]|nr:hypothetical protein [Candidatus Moranbacteria bacterium]